MAWNMYYKNLRKATEEPKEPLEPYHGNLQKCYVPRETLTEKKLRELGKMPFQTAFHRADRTRGMGDNIRVEHISATERRINTEDPIDPPPKRKYKPFLTAFHVKRPDEMRRYAMQNYSLRSTDYQTYCREAKAKKEASMPKRKKNQTHRNTPPHESIFSEQLTQRMQKHGKRENTKREQTARRIGIPIPKLAWGDTDSEFLVEEHSGSDEKHQRSEPRVVSSIRPRQSSRTRASSRPVTSRRPVQSSSTFFQTEVLTSRPSTSRAPGQTQPPQSSRRMIQSSRRKSKPNTSRKKKKTKAKMRRFTESQKSPRSRSNNAWCLKKLEPEPFDVNPSLSDWEN